MNRRLILHTPRLTRPVIVAIVLLGLLAFSLDLVYPHARGGAQTGEAATRAPLGVVSSQQNPLQVATLHWYNANLTTQFTLGSAPYGIAFDGTNLWVTNNGSNNVMKVRPSDGAILGTFAVGTNPIAVAYDGANVWVANINSNNVTKLNGSTGAVLGTFTVGTQPAGIAFDGTNIWVLLRLGPSLRASRLTEPISGLPILAATMSPSCHPRALCWAPSRRAMVQTVLPTMASISG